MVLRREFLKTTSLSAAYALTSRHALPSSHLPAAKPNILIVVSDQHRVGLTRRSGYPFDTSPGLDRLASRGIAFDRAYCTAPVCAPSRTSLITGRWPHAHRVRSNVHEPQAFFSTDLFDVLKSAGYKTGLCGKNNTYLRQDKLDFWREYKDHLGWQPPNPPKELVEFDEWRRLINFAAPNQPTPFPLEVQFSYRVVSNAIEFLQQFEGQPFALEVSFPEPHSPEQVPKPYFDMFPPAAIPPRVVGPEALAKKGFIWQWEYELQNHIYPNLDLSRYVSNYLGSLRMVDDQLTRLLSFMEHTHLLENTLIVYLADHGTYLGDYGLIRKGVGMSESLARIPMVWSGWGIPERNWSHRSFVSIADVMPTLCEAVGAEIPKGVQGRSLWPLLRGEAYPEEEFRSIYVEVGAGGLFYDKSDNVPFSIAEFKGMAGMYLVPEEHKTFNELNSVSQSGYRKMVCMGDWKLIFDMMGYGELYHLSSDPYELTNLFGDSSVVAVQGQLMAELLMWTIRTQDTLPLGNEGPGIGIKVKWPEGHNWYAPYRQGKVPRGFIP